MTPLRPSTSALSSPQRRCHLLLMLNLPGYTVTPETLGCLNGVDDDTVRQDIADTGQEIERYHRLRIAPRQDGSYRIEGSALDNRLCLLHWLRRALRICPHFVADQFTPAVKTVLKHSATAKALYDDTNLHALVNLCARRMERQFDARDTQFLRIYLQYCLMQCQLGLVPDFTQHQRDWTRDRPEYHAASDIIRHWRRRVNAPPPDDEHLFLAVLFMMLRIPHPQRDAHREDVRLRRAVYDIITRFRHLSGMRFSDEQGLSNQLYIHLAQALNRSVFRIGIDNSLPDEIHRLYPKLMRTTREALLAFEHRFALRFSEEELGLVAVIFGAWLMQENALHEKQVLLLTGNNPQLEQQLERQIRELTLLPLNIKHLTLHTFQHQGAPGEVALVITPYPTTLPLFSPPLVHATPPLEEQQQQRIRQILES